MRNLGWHMCRYPINAERMATAVSVCLVCVGPRFKPHQGKGTKIKNDQREKASKKRQTERGHNRGAHLRMLIGVSTGGMFLSEERCHVTTYGLVGRAGREHQANHSAGGPVASCTNQEDETQKAI